MNKIILSLLLLVAISTVFSQKKKITVEDAIMAYRKGLYPKEYYNIAWKDNNNFSYLNAWREIIAINTEKNKTNSIVDVEKINSDGSIELPYIENFEWINKDLVRINAAGQIVIYNTKNEKIESTFKVEGAENVQFCSITNNVAYTLKNNLYINTSKDKAIQVTKDENEGIVNGNAYVHRQEFGINQGSFWSPKGKYLAFYRKDETMVADYPLVDITTRIAELENMKYPMAGMKSEEVTLGVYNIKECKTIFLETGEPKEQYLTNICWDPSEKYIYIAVLNRDQNHMKLNKYDAVSGKFVKTLFEEKKDRYVEPENPMIFIDSKPNEFLWYSERDGFNHLYHYNTDGKLIKQLTKGNWEVTEFYGFDKKMENLFIQSTAESPIDRHIYSINVKSGKMKKLSKKEGYHSATFNSDFSMFIDSYSSKDVPHITNLCNSKGKVEKTILESENPVADYDMPEIEIGKIKAADEKTDLYYRLIKPTDFDPNKKYPAIVYVYGGPHAQMVTNTFLGGVRFWQIHMAQKGYVMLVVDNRGSAHRGYEFESIIHRECGQKEMKDQMKGIELLKSLGYVDMDKIGVHGWSYGGFMTTSLMVNYPDVFKVGVAGGPVIDWKFYEVMYGERYMDTPQDNPDGYEKTQLLTRAKDLQGKLLIVHGGIDPVVVWQNSLAFIRECIKAGKQVDYFVYPRAEHNVRGADRIHLMEKVTMYFDDYLK